MTEAISMGLVVWDFDGTLADTFAAIRLAADEALAGQGLPSVDDAELRGVIGLSLPVVVGRLATAAVGGEAGPGLVATLETAYRSAFAAHSRDHMSLFPGIAELLDELTGAGVPLAIATSKSQRGVRLALERLGIALHFGVVVADDDVRHGKPHPEMVLAACTSCRVRPEEAVVVGDTTFDVEMGQRAGASTIAVTWGNQARAQLAPSNPTHLVATVAELHSLLQRRDGAT
jgi:phosphoglycolate phosphatase